MEREFGLVSEPFRLQAPAPAILAAAWGSLREAVLAGRVARPVLVVPSCCFARALRRLGSPGESLGWLTPAELPADLGWARPRAEIAAPFASLAAAVDAETREILGGGTAAAVWERIRAWQGE